MCDRITSDLERKGYYWEVAWGIKRYESFILSKFIIDQSFESVMREDISEDEKKCFHHLSDKIFTSLFDKEFSVSGINSENMKSEIEKKIKDYFAAYNSTDEYPDHNAQMYMLITKSKSPVILEKEINKLSICLRFLKSNKNFSQVAEEYEQKLKRNQEKASAFKLAEVFQKPPPPRSVTLALGNKPCPVPLKPPAAASGWG